MVCRCTSEMGILRFGIESVGECNGNGDDSEEVIPPYHGSAGVLGIWVELGLCVILHGDWAYCNFQAVCMSLKA
jgi:hypothetical protein